MLIATFAAKQSDVRRLVFFILMLQLCSGYSLGTELLKVPYLLRHLKVYQENLPEKTWFDFFCLHYADTTHRNADPAHKHLPLQAVSVSSGVYMLPEDYSPPPICRRLQTERTDLPIYDETLLPADFRMKLLRPPRI